MAKDGRLASPLYVQFVMGVQNAMPVDRPVFDFYIETLKRIAPDAEWCGAGIGPNQIVLNEWCVAAGGHARTGLEDNLRLDRATLAPSNAALVRRVVELCEKYERPVATPAEARALLHLTPVPRAMKRKVYDAAASALDDLLFDGMTIAAGGFGLCGIPELLIGAIRDAGRKDLTVASNNAGVDDFGLGVLLQTRQVRKMISSYVGENDEFMRQYLSGELELEFNPQGTLAERMRAGGAGIPGFYTRTGVGTVIAEGKEDKDFDGETYILERGIVADLSIVKAWKGDEQGNLVYRKTARNFNPNAATCGRVCVAEVEEIVPLGSLDPDGIHTPGIFVHRILQGPHEKRIEQRTVRAA